MIGPTQDADSSSDGGIAGHMYFYNPYANNSNSVTCVGQFGYRDGSNKFNILAQPQDMVLFYMADNK